MSDKFEMLKAYLRKKKDNFVEVREWCGDTEAGFHTEIDFDIEKLMAEIDKFSAAFAKAKEE